MNCSIKSLVVVNVKLCDLLQSLSKYIPITDSLGERATSDQDRGEREGLLDGREREWKKHIPKIREREGIEKKPFPKLKWKKIHSHILGMGIRGYHSQEYPGTGTGMKKQNMTLKNI